MSIRYVLYRYMYLHITICVCIYIYVHMNLFIYLSIILYIVYRRIYRMSTYHADVPYYILTWGVLGAPGRVEADSADAWKMNEKLKRGGGTLTLSGWDTQN